MGGTATGKPCSAGSRGTRWAERARENQREHAHQSTKPDRYLNRRDDVHRTPDGRTARRVKCDDDTSEKYRHRKCTPHTHSGRVMSLREQTHHTDRGCERGDTDGGEASPDTRHTDASEGGDGAAGCQDWTTLGEKRGGVRGTKTTDVRTVNRSRDDKRKTTHNRVR